MEPNAERLLVKLCVTNPPRLRRGFKRVSLGAGNRKVVTLEIGGDNLHNMLPKLGQNAPASLRGYLAVEVQGVSASLPQNIECLLTEPDFARTQ